MTVISVHAMKSLSRAAVKAAGARLRRLGLGGTAPQWADRAALCERCSLRIISRGISYCGVPFTEMIQRDPATDGCGCPTKAKAQDPDEHCPLDRRNLPVLVTNGRCACKWCEIAT